MVTQLILSNITDLSGNIETPGKLNLFARPGRQDWNFDVSLLQLLEMAGPVNDMAWLFFLSTLRGQTSDGPCY